MNPNANDQLTISRRPRAAILQDPLHFQPPATCPDMPHRVIVSTGARLHFGLLAHAPLAGRQFGGVGLMVDHPGFQLEVEVAPHGEPADHYSGPEVWRQRVLDVVQRCRELAPTASESCLWTLEKSILPHVGLGSGTQLSLAVARAYSALSDKSALTATELAHLAGRGLRSALGIHGFEQGGLLVEAGKLSTEQVSPAVSRVDWPDDWRLLLVRPTNAIGLCGSSEIQAFANLLPMPDAVSARLCQITLLELLPAVLEADYETCAEALFQFGRLVGDYFAPAQGGTYSTPRIRDLVQHLREQGIRGVGQSSWGPTAFVMCPNRSMADELRGDLLQTGWGDCEILCVAARNEGAKMECLL